MQRFFPHFSVAVFGAALALVLSAFASYRLGRIPRPGGTGTEIRISGAQGPAGLSGSNIFGGAMEMEIEAAPEESGGPVAPTGPVKKLLLLGVLKSGIRSTAIIKDVAADSVVIFRTGAWVFGDMEQLSSVGATSALLTSSGGERRLLLGVVSEGLALPPAAEELTQDPNAKTLSRAELNASVRAPEEILGSSRIFPEMRGGKMIGFKVGDVQPGTILQKMGIASGDIIKRANQHPLDDIGRAGEVWNRLKNASEIHMLIERGGKDQTMSYYFRP